MKKIILKFIYWILARFARKVIDEHQPFVIAVTGSVGKTSTKEAIFQVLVDKFGNSVRKNHGNLNAEIGIPLTILGFDHLPSTLSWPVFLVKAYLKTFEKNYPKYLVMEMGVEHKGDITYFGTIVKPDIAVITSVSGAHLVNFKSIEEYQEEKISISKILKENGALVLNFDDPILAKTNTPKMITFGIQNQTADFRAESITSTIEGTEFRIVSTGQKIAVKSKLLGEHLVYSDLAAFAIGHFFGIQSLQIKSSLEKVTPVNGRMRLIPGVHDTWLIDDTYNSNPTSAKAALDLLSKIKYPNRKVLIFGNMNELGYKEKEAHKTIGEFAKGKCDLAIFVGHNAKIMASAYGDTASVQTFANRRELEGALSSIIKPKDLVLIKASQNNNHFEEITKKLMAKPNLAETLLVRQGKGWNRKK